MKELEAIRDTINKWRKVVEISQPLKGDCHYPKTNAASETYDGCADDLEALLPALEKACTEIEIRTESRLSELMTMQMGKVRSLEAEVAALREPMSCTHPRACWREPSSVHPDGHCSMCVEKRLALAVALGDAAKHRLVRYPTDPLSRCSCGWKPTSCDIAAEWEQHILTLIPSADAQALDVHDAEVRNEALEEGALAVWMIHQSAAAKLRALKRGGEQLVLAQAQVAIVDRSLGDLGDTSAQAALDAYVQENVDRAVLDFTISALDYFSKKSTTGQQGERGIYSRTYQKFGEFVNSEYPKISANRNKVMAADPLKEKP